MIVPLIDARKLNSIPALPDLINSVRHWSLFGAVAVTGVESWQALELEQLARQTGGSVELQIDGAGRTEGELLELLNQGASLILACEGASGRLTRPPSIPPESWLELNPESSYPASSSATSHSLASLSERRRQLTRASEPAAEQLARLDRLGVDVLVDIELLEFQPHLIAEFFRETLTSDRPDGLWPTVIVDEMGIALGLAYSNEVSLLDAIVHRRGTYWSRSRGGLWVKGLTSGNTQQLLGIRLDCDRDCLRFQVAQHGQGFCHLKTYSCFGYERTIATVMERLRERCQASDEGSFTKKLIRDSAMLQTKLLEEARELAEAQTAAEVAFEAADVMYFSLVKMLAAEVELAEVYQELARRMTRVIRRQNKLES